MTDFPLVIGLISKSMLFLSVIKLKNNNNNNNNATSDNNKPDRNNSLIITPFKELFQIWTHELQNCDLWMLLFLALIILLLLKHC